MPIVCGIQFRGAGKVYYFDPCAIDDLLEGDCVVVETARGRELGYVAQEPRDVQQDKIVGDLKPVVQRATPLDLLEAQRYQQQETQAMETCREQVERFSLPMKVVGAEYNYDGSRLTFYFASEQRVDFRDLVRELAHVFKTRIELRQIGVRDEARLLGGIGKCGRPLCCATWLGEFSPVSIKMAKQQDLPLSPMEISGLCGRLLCCLTYENDYYREIKGRFPRAGRRIETPVGEGKVTRVSVLRETVQVLLDDGTELELSAEQVSGEEPIEMPSNGRGLGEVQQRALSQVVARSATPQDEDDGDRAERGAREPGPSAPDRRGANPGAAERPSRSGPRRRGRGGAGRDGAAIRPACGRRVRVPAQVRRRKATNRRRARVASRLAAARGGRATRNRRRARVASRLAASFAAAARQPGAPPGRRGRGNRAAQ